MSIRRFLFNDPKCSAIFYALVFLSSAAHAAVPSVQRAPTPLNEVVVTGEREHKEASSAASPLPDTQGTRVYAGKKTSAIALSGEMPVVNNNQRQIYGKTPGLLISEESTPLVSIGYRGLNPDRAQYMQVMKDGLPIVADPFGYPEAYYVPPAEVVDRVEFVRGGSALMYGPQPGGAVNYVTRRPVQATALRVESSNTFGSHDLFSTFEALSGTSGSVGYDAFFHHRQSQGFREFNSQYDVNYGGGKIMLDQDETSTWTAAIDVYEETHGEPGGLLRADFDDNISKTTRLMDHFELNRLGASLAWEKHISDKTLLEWKGFGGVYERFSWRQRGGGFGTLPTGPAASTNDIQEQEFFTGGMDTRIRHDWEGLDSDGNTLTSGIFYYHSTSTRVEKRGQTGDALDGDLRKDSDRSVNNAAFFIENLFRYGAFSITPGVRLENIWQGIRENRNADKTTVPLGDEDDYSFVALAGIGAEYEFSEALELYANYSESYRPKVYADAVPLGINQTIGANLEEGNAWQAETGLRGQAGDALTWDVSVFHMAFDGQTGTVGSNIQNVGDAEYNGVELAADLKVMRWLAGDGEAERSGDVDLFAALTFLDAEFVGGPNTGKSPQYAPDHNLRAGIVYDFRKKARLGLSATFLDDHFGDDSNLTQRILPSYKVWDLEGEIKVWEDKVSIFGGINNLFNERYFARVTSGGIDPADGRNYYGGVRVLWG
jgi:Fe(3+) dicitrate transport protein